MESGGETGRDICSVLAYRKRSLLMGVIRTKEAPVRLRRKPRQAPAAGLQERPVTPEWQSLLDSGRPYALAQGREPLLVSTADHVIGRAVFDLGEFDFAKFEQVLDLLGTSHVGTLVDVGANIGTVTVPALARGLATRAIAIEPHPTNIRLLECNLRLNDVHDRCTAVWAAATRTGAGEILLEQSPDNSGDHRVMAASSERQTHANPVRVPSIRLDEAVGDLQAGDLVWIDVQGYEVEVLGGAPRVLASGVPLVLEVWPFGLSEHGRPDALVEVLVDYSAFVDLSHPERGKSPITAIPSLVEEYAVSGWFTDVLVIP